MNESQQKAARDVVRAARLLVQEELTINAQPAEPARSWMTRAHVRSVLAEAIYLYDQIPDETKSITNDRKGFAGQLAKSGDTIRIEVPRIFYPGFLPLLHSEWEVAAVNSDGALVLCAGDATHVYRPASYKEYTIVHRAEEKSKRTPQIGEFWRMINGSLSGQIGIVEREETAESGKTTSYIRFATGDMFWANGSWLEFAFPARKEGEFRQGDIVRFVGMEWEVSSGQIGRIGGIQVVYVNSMHFASLDRRQGMWARPSDLTLTTPTELRRMGV